MFWTKLLDNTLVLNASAKCRKIISISFYWGKKKKNTAQSPCAFSSVNTEWKILDMEIFDTFIRSQLPLV